MHSSHLNMSWNIQLSHKLVSAFATIQEQHIPVKFVICQVFLKQPRQIRCRNGQCNTTTGTSDRNSKKLWIIHPNFWGHWGNTCGVTNSTIMKWKWLFMTGCECKSLISTMIEFLKFCQYGKNSSVLLGIHWKIMILKLNKRTTFNAVLTCHLIFTTLGTLHIIHPSYTLHSDNWFIVLCSYYFQFRLRIRRVNVVKHNYVNNHLVYIYIYIYNKWLLNLYTMWWLHSQLCQLRCLLAITKKQHVSALWP
jgi:hypothetical protein